MNNETSKTSTPAAASPLTAKPDLVKNIGGTTFDIHIHFSETSRETFTDKVVRLIKNDSGDETAYLKARLKLKPNQVCDVYEIDAAAGE